MQTSGRSWEGSFLLSMLIVSEEHWFSSFFDQKSWSLVLGLWSGSLSMNKVCLTELGLFLCPEFIFMRSWKVFFTMVILKNRRATGGCSPCRVHSEKGTRRGHTQCPVYGATIQSMNQWPRDLLSRWLCHCEEAMLPLVLSLHTNLLGKSL